MRMSTAGKAEQPLPNVQGFTYAEHDRDNLLRSISDTFSLPSGKPIEEANPTKNGPEE